MTTSGILPSWPGIQAAYQGYRKYRVQSKQQPRRHPRGFILAGNEAMQSGEFEPVETALVYELLENVDVLINVGANIGYYCCLALHQKKQVVAFEPLPANLHFLYQNMEANGWSNAVEIYPIALSSQKGIAKLYGAGTGASLIPGWAGQSETPISVAMSTLDAMIGHRFETQQCLVLVDVEGVELELLKGAAEVLNLTQKPIWFVEISITEHLPEGQTINPKLAETFELFSTHGYRAFTAEQPPREVLLGEIHQIAATEIDTIGVHNFIFVDQTSQLPFAQS